MLHIVCKKVIKLVIKKTTTEKHWEFGSTGLGGGGIAILSWDIWEASLRRPLLTTRQAHARHSQIALLNDIFLSTFYRVKTETQSNYIMYLV